MLVYSIIFSENLGGEITLFSFFLPKKHFLFSFKRIWSIGIRLPVSTLYAIILKNPIENIHGNDFKRTLGS